MKTSNPVLARLGQAAERERAAGYAQPGPYGQPGYPQQYPPYQQRTRRLGYPAAPPTVTPMTLDDVVVKTVMLLGHPRRLRRGRLGARAGRAGSAPPGSAPRWSAWSLGLIISFSRMANPALVVAYAVVEGVFVGMVSKAFESRLRRHRAPGRGRPPSASSS